MSKCCSTYLCCNQSIKINGRIINTTCRLIKSKNDSHAEIYWPEFKCLFQLASAQPTWPWVKGFTLANFKELMFLNDPDRQKKNKQTASQTCTRALTLHNEIKLSRTFSPCPDSLYEIVGMLKSFGIFSISKCFCKPQCGLLQSENALGVSSCSAEQAPLYSSGCTHRLLDEVLSQCLYTVYKPPSFLYQMRGGRQFLNECTRRSQTLFAGGNKTLKSCCAVHL